MDDKNLRQTNTNCCTLAQQTGPIIVRQVIGEKEKQKVLDIHVVVPEQKPSIEQIVDVFVKDVDVHSVDVITDKVIVRGDFEIKAIYVACLPDQPVHAVEIRHFKWTQDVDLPGARRGMDADASVVVEFVDYDVNEHSRAYHYKYENDDEYDHNHDHDDDDDCDDDDDDDDCNDSCHQHHHHHHHCDREFDVSVVLKITAKVLADREIQMSQTTPATPKG